MAHTKKWSAKVTTDSTHPPEGLFNKDPATIARTLASKRVSPKGPGSGMRMLTFYINRAGKNLSASRRAKLGRAKELLSQRVRAAHARARKKDRGRELTAFGRWPSGVCQRSMPCILPAPVTHPTA